MQTLDWILFFGFLSYVVFDGVRRSRDNHSAEDHFLAGRRAPWWVLGFSIMATQASAITMIGTTGKGWESGTRFVQFYYALPLAMLILAVTLVPLYYRHRVFTAYEYLGQRFDRKTRILTAAVFLIQRGLAAGIVIYAPSVVLAAILGIDEGITIAVMGTVAVLYTAIGGLRAVLATDVKQMIVMTVGLIVAFYCVIDQFPEGVGVSEAWNLASALERTTLADIRWDPSEKYTVWSSLIGGTFLFLSYFGCDQSQAQRLLAGRSLGHVRGALFMNALLKVPFQLLVLTIGTFLFVGHLFVAPPVSFVPTEEAAVSATPELEATTAAYHRAHRALTETATGYLEGDADQAALVAAWTAASSARDETRAQLAATQGSQLVKETNYIFPSFILGSLPIGLVGLLIAAIFAAALSSIDSELNAMATVWVVDIQRAMFGGEADDAELRHSRGATIALGVLATGCAYWFSASTQAGQSVIEAVNLVGSYFYGSILGVFVLAMGFRFVRGTAAFGGLIGGMATVAILEHVPAEPIGFLYLNPAGAIATIVVALAIEALSRR